MTIAEKIEAAGFTSTGEYVQAADPLDGADSYNPDLKRAVLMAIVEAYEPST